MNQSARGFTIVELLIVIVVIAILATLSYVGYTGISRKANNAAIVNAASGSYRLIQAYTAEYGAYPYSVTSSSVTLCMTNESGCLSGTGSLITPRAEFNTEMARVGVLPQSVPNSGSEANGLIYQYVPSTVVNGVSQPLRMIYWLQGLDQDCGLGGIFDKYNIDTGKTRCSITIPGPPHQD